MIDTPISQPLLHQEIEKEEEGWREVDGDNRIVAALSHRAVLRVADLSRWRGSPAAILPCGACAEQPPHPNYRMVGCMCAAILTQAPCKYSGPFARAMRRGISSATPALGSLSCLLQPLVGMELS